MAYGDAGTCAARLGEYAAAGVEVVVRFFAAIEAGDIDTVRSIYSPAAAMYLRVEDGHVTRIEEYLDSANRATIKTAVRGEG